MLIQIFDVTHGFCALLTADNGNVMLFDCGHNEATGFRPSAYLPRIGCSKVHHLVVSNFDRDHLSDLHNVAAFLPIGRFFRNQTIPPEELVRMNPYPRFEDTNNLSLVSFVNYDGMTVVFPGDLETAGWNALLADLSFRQHLARVNIFVASHHGRASGYCEEVFRYCRPDMVLISDKEIVHDSQENCYREHANGVTWNGGPDKRYVLTTRSDGDITINKNIGRGYDVSIV